MTMISMRVYIRQIKQLINTGQTEEAISHCLHILKSYPKYIDAYRVLGEAYLERGNEAEAADIFQRVLSSIPDDFVSHIGMSVIREEDQKLDEAIWHMERAYEVQPSNSTIQTEIRRLYGSREGIEPQKVRLTRGALARMYVKGELFPQAIGELQAALAEDPNRFDLQILLADVYFRTGQENKGIDTCSQALEKLPYCLGMNMLMAQYFLGMNQEDKAEQYVERLLELDPYYTHLDSLDGNPESVPDQAIQIEKFVVSPLPKPAADEPLDIKPEEVPTESSQEEQMVAVAASSGISDEFDSDVTSPPPVDLEESGKIPENIEPGQHSDWLQELDKEPEEEDTQPVFVPISTDIDAEQIETDKLDKDLQEEPKSGIPDWLEDLAEEDTSQESDTAGELIVDKPVDMDVIEDVSKEEVLEKMFPPVSDASEKGAKKQTSDYSHRTPEEVQAAEIDKPPRNYSELVKSRQNLPEIIKELEQAADKDPENPSLLRNLGDAYLRNNQLTEALEAYARAEKL